MAAEKALQNAVLRKYGTMPGLRLWRQNTGVVRMPPNRQGERGRFVRFSIPGAADLTGILPMQQHLVCPHCQQMLATPPLGVRLEIECKAPGKKPTTQQAHYGAMIQRHSGLWLCVDNMGELAAALAPYLPPPGAQP